MEKVLNLRLRLCLLMIFALSIVGCSRKVQVVSKTVSPPGYERWDELVVDWSKMPFPLPKDANFEESIYSGLHKAETGTQQERQIWAGWLLAMVACSDFTSSTVTMEKLMERMRSVYGEAKIPGVRRDLGLAITILETREKMRSARISKPDSTANTNAAASPDAKLRQ